MGSQLATARCITRSFINNLAIENTEVHFIPDFCNELGICPSFIINNGVYDNCDFFLSDKVIISLCIITMVYITGSKVKETTVFVSFAICHLCMKSRCVIYAEKLTIRNPDSYS